MVCREPHCQQSHDLKMVRQSEKATDRLAVESPDPAGTQTQCLRLQHNLGSGQSNVFAVELTVDWVPGICAEDDQEWCLFEMCPSDKVVSRMARNLLTHLLVSDDDEGPRLPIAGRWRPSSCLQKLLHHVAWDWVRAIAADAASALEQGHEGFG